MAREVTIVIEIDVDLDLYEPGQENYKGYVSAQDYIRDLADDINEERYSRLKLELETRPVRIRRKI